MDYMIKEETLTDIADAIRGQTGDVNPIAVSDFASEISSIVGGGSHVELTQAEYDALTEEEKNNGSVYFITDTNGDGEDFQPVIYSLNEREIGVWTDGKPLYEKTYIFSSTLTLYRNTWTVISALDDIASVVDKVISGDGYFYVSAGGGYQPLAIQYSEGHIQAQIARYIESSNITQMTIRYTKSTDTAGSGTWTPQGVPAVHFSTDEHIIGTWIDGSTLYEKTLIFNNVLVTQVDSTSELIHGVSNIGSFKRVTEAYADFEGGQNWKTAENVIVIPGSQTFSFQWGVGDRAILLKYLSSSETLSANANRSYLFTIQYTKST